MNLLEWLSSVSDMAQVIIAVAAILFTIRMSEKSKSPDLKVSLAPTGSDEKSGYRLFAVNLSDSEVVILQNTTPVPVDRNNQNREILTRTEEADDDDYNLYENVYLKSKEERMQLLKSTVVSNRDNLQDDDQEVLTEKYEARVIPEMYANNINKFRNEVVIMPRSQSDLWVFSPELRNVVTNIKSKDENRKYSQQREIHLYFYDAVEKMHYQVKLETISDTDSRILSSLKKQAEHFPDEDWVPRNL